MGKTAKWFSDRFDSSKNYESFSSISVPQSKHTFWYYWGGMSVFFLLIQIITGALLTLYYKPTIEDAYLSVKYISEDVEFGSFIRSLHYWSAHALITTVIIHLARTFFMKAYRKPRELAWIGGVILLIVLLASAFTGQILPWNELSFFGAAVGISQVEKIPVLGSLAAHFLKGGAYIGSETPGRMFSLHSVILPLIILFLILVHVWLTHYWGLSKTQESENEEKRLRVYFGFFYRIIIASLSALALLTIVSIFLPKGFGNPYDIMNPTEAPSAIHPEWYFMWVFQMLKFDAFMPDYFSVFFISLMAIFVLCIPFIENRLALSRGAHIMKTLGIVFIIFIAVMTIWAYVQAGFDSSGSIQQTAGLTGGMDKYSFAGMVVFSVLFMIVLIKLRMKTKIR